MALCLLRFFYAIFILILISSNLNCLAEDYDKTIADNNKFPYLNMDINSGILGSSTLSSGPDIKIDLRKYLADLKQRLNVHWTTDASKPVQISFKVYKDGRIADTQVETSSEIKEFDEFALKAVLNCNPLPPLPSICADYIVFRFTFDRPSKSVSNEPTIVEFGRNRAELAKEYFDEMRQKIKRYWYPPKDGGDMPTLIFTLHKDGSVFDIRIVHPAGTEYGNKAAINAITNAAPFKPFPCGLEDNYSIDLTFSMNVFPSKSGLYHRF